MEDMKVRATSMDMLAILVQAKGKPLKAREIVVELMKYNLITSTRELADYSKELRALGYKVVSDKSCNGGYFITEKRDDLVHQDKMLKSIQDSIQIEREVVWKLINEFDKEHPSLPSER